MFERALGCFCILRVGRGRKEGGREGGREGGEGKVGGREGNVVNGIFAMYDTKHAIAR